MVAHLRLSVISQFHRQHRQSPLCTNLRNMVERKGRLRFRIEVPSIIQRVVRANNDLDTRQST